ncbi:hypothetical protein QTP88_012108 [Uroleucon formosanum]
MNTFIDDLSIISGSDTILFSNDESRSSSSHSMQLLEDQSQTISRNEQQSSNSIKMATKTNATILDGIFFKLISSDSKNVIASYIKCQSKNVNIKGSKFSSSNFKSHLKRKHDSSILDEYGNTEENPFFKEMFIASGILKNKSLTLMSRRSLSRKIETRLNTSIEKLNSTLEKVYLFTTADVYSAKRKSFMGVTVHWIDEDLLERKSASLACRRFKDNGSNVVKAFDVFGIKITHFRKLSDRNDSDESESDSSVNSFQSEDVENEPSIILFRHIRCCAHTLSLCVTSDIIKTIKSSPHLHERHTKVIQKCKTLWNAASGPKSAEIIQSVLGHTLSRPGEVRWNSLFDLLTQIQKIKEKSSELTRALNLKQCSFTISDHNYIEEFLFCVKPLSQALDILQGDKNVFYGMVFPTLLCLQRKLMVINSEQLIIISCFLYKAGLKFEDENLDHLIFTFFGSHLIQLANIFLVSEEINLKKLPSSMVELVAILIDFDIILL